MRGVATRVGLAVAGAATVLATAGCGTVSGRNSVADAKSLVIGVNGDQPGLSSRTADGTYEGFDIDVARYIAGRLGATVTFRPVTSATRESMIQTGAVDLVVASYSITQDRKTKVAFAGSYYVAHQDILVRATDAPAIRDVHDLAGRRLCRVPGSVSFPRVREERGVDVRAQDAPGYTGCLEQLLGGRLDAVSTDDLILAGLAATSGAAGGTGKRLRIVNAPFSDEPYGIGIARGDLDGCTAVNQAITRMYQDGTAERLLRKWFTPVGLKVTTTVPQFEGCD
ncbi:glutamate ABC transporter substrate-binding protein [Actinomadura sp. NBRC 104412]|uniref:glutamate ABC transporter substrate-binding protein n=1 Tax=Actinomadura sp. NBRC 104412 TaxID=3032203 RepID=UPI0024A4B3E0|nr:glutamate ABC transporter substrate-binding protein [Actinomadura sp. NBRC 104412]GLZ07108.1 glutamate ABC transporter substrate-binding protein [Actinomadura sp. NBRC 104412]